MKCNEVVLELLKEELIYLNDGDVYALYKDFKRRKISSFENNKPLDYEKYTEIIDVLREEILRRCC